ncbi:cold-shock protein [Actinophytocola sp.]|uniref:cold-shock protein n=1 Tax=Actinophytocola sp. TaxID=1872138 RepID=UPI003899A064
MVRCGGNRWFNGTKGFGFHSARWPRSETVRAPVSEVQGYESHGLAENQRVEFEVGEGRKGPQATWVRVI